MILDTNALSDFLKELPAVGRILVIASSFCIPVIVLGQYRFGLKTSRQSKELAAKLDSLLYDARILLVEEATTHIYAGVRAELKAAGTLIPENDVWIAALVRQHRMPLMSRDGHFDLVKGLERTSW